MNSSVLADLVIEPYGQILPEESNIEQDSKSHVVNGNINKSLALLVSV